MKIPSFSNSENKKNFAGVYYSKITLPKYSVIKREQAKTPMIVFEDKKTATIGNIMFNI